MSSYRWRAEEEHLLRLLLPTNTHREISEQINRRFDLQIAGFPCERSEDAVRRKCEREEWTAESCAGYSEKENDYQQRWNQIAEIQEKFKTESLLRRRGCQLPGPVARKILSISDIHFPLAREDLLQEIINEHRDADIVVINGDLLEGYIFSTFEKAKSIAAIDEYNAAFAFIENLSKMFPAVVIVEGNHDIRPSRYLGQQGIRKEASQVLRPNLIARMANGEKLDSTGLLVEKLDFSNVHYQARESWYVKIGKTIFVHPYGRGSSKPGYTVSAVGDKLLRRYDTEEVDSVVCGHTHQIYKGVINGVLMIEQGCLAGIMTYLHKPNNYSAKNYMNGYAVIYQDEAGNTDFNKSGPIYLGECIPPKKELEL